MKNGHHICGSYTYWATACPPPLSVSVCVCWNPPHSRRPSHPSPPPPGVFVGRVKYLSNINPVAVRELRPVFVQYLCKYSPPAASLCTDCQVSVEKEYVEHTDTVERSTQTQWGDKGQLLGLQINLTAPAAATHKPLLHTCWRLWWLSRKIRQDIKWIGWKGTGIDNEMNWCCPRTVCGGK